MIDKYLNFTCKEILPALLNKTKVTTMRKAYVTEITDYKRDPHKPPVEGEDRFFPYSVTRFNPKPAKFKVGDEVWIIWNLTDIRLIHWSKDDSDYNLWENKILGKVKIVSVKKIEIGKEPSYYFVRLKGQGHTQTSAVCWDLCESEGFKSPEQMFSYLEEYAEDLTGDKCKARCACHFTQAKQFWLYEFSWKLE